MPGQSRDQAPFSDEDLSRYWPNGIPSNQPPADPRSRVPDDRLKESILKYAPHLRESFVTSDDWWKIHWGTPQAHVRLATQMLTANDLVFKPLQMFRFILWRGIEDNRALFTNSEPKYSLEAFREALDKANETARWFLNNPTTQLSEGWHRCEQITNAVYLTAQPVPGEGRFSFPKTLVPELEAVFRQHYNQENMLLIGGSDLEAYRVQDEYAQNVVSILSKEHPAYAVHALVILGKVYGRTSIPLLGVASVSLLWNLVKCDFYKDQLSLVRLDIPLVDGLADSPSRYTGG